MNPYEVLGIRDNATMEEVNAAYKNLAAKYHPSNYANGPLSEQAARKMKEINDAYDQILLNNGSGYGSNNYFYNNSYSDNKSDMFDIRKMIANGRLDDAEMLLDGISPSNRSAEWYYLKGEILNRRGWFEQARDNYSQAYRMQPDNQEFRSAFDRINNASTGGYRAGRNATTNSGANCSACDICQGLICADCCCECMGGDLIPCC